MEWPIVTAFLAVAVAAWLACLLVVARIGFGRLESSLGIERDGPTLRQTVSDWQAVDLSGVVRAVPRPNCWSWLVFADHSLESFPALVCAMNHSLSSDPALQTLVLARKTAGLDSETAARLNIHAPVIPVDQSFYDRYRVRVMPYSVILNDEGMVVWKGLIHTENQIAHILRGLRPIESRSALDPSNLGAAS
jgi:hypothetical protein